MTDAPFERLLAVQGHDTDLARLKHRADNLESAATLAKKQAQRAELDSRVDSISADQAERDKLSRRYEQELQAVEAKEKEEDERLYSGQVTSTREVDAIKAEMSSLKRRQSDLEDKLLELMDATEAAASDRDALGAAAEGLDAEIATATEAVASDRAEIDREIEAAEAARATDAADVPDELLSTYERLRPQFDGIAAAKLNGRTCGGCFLDLSAVEWDRVKKEPADSLIHCEECGRILVR